VPFTHATVLCPQPAVQSHVVSHGSPPHAFNDATLQQACSVYLAYTVLGGVSNTNQCKAS
jgi:hypothetical protein